MLEGHRDAGPSWGSVEWLGLGDPQAVEQRLAGNSALSPAAFIPFWGLFFCSPEFPSMAGIGRMTKG